MHDISRKRFFSGFYPALGDLYLVVSLTGEPKDDVYSLFGISEEENERILLERYEASNNHALAQIVHYHRCVKSFWYRDYEAALEHEKKYDNFTEMSTILRVTDINTVLIRGLSSFIVARREKRRELIPKGEEVLFKIQMWAKSNKWNAENKALLLEAESHFVNGDSEKATAAYEQSIQSAHNHKFLHEKALACELFGTFLVEQGDLSRGNDVLEEARELYESWGAFRKAELIFPL